MTTIQLRNKKFIIPKRAKPIRCKYCNRALKNKNVRCCSNCYNKERNGLFIIKQMREKNGIV